MSGLNAFLSQNAIKVENEKHAISDRFLNKEKKPVEWEIKAIDESLNESIRESCKIKERDKRTRTVTERINHELYLAKLAVECVVYPNLKDAQLQESYGVLGADKLIKKMLTSGEYGRLLEIVQEVNGFDTENDLVEEAKN